MNVGSIPPSTTPTLGNNPLTEDGYLFFKLIILIKSNLGEIVKKSLLKIF